MDIQKDSRITFKKEIFTSKGENNFVILNYETGIYLGLDEMGAMFWELLKRFEELQVIVNHVINEYEVEEDQVWQDLYRFIEKLVHHQIVTVNEHVKG
ncbi:Coenzyme PQQ synthesis protein D (PqqD) [Bacillus sp. 491mf]|uniref:PqqD family protein n=1 Tax=Bacillus sp. 491mf TaxID=1761755 RepID=UPI0008ED3E39|nr:PqqD family protein [Bacillus sp. 491mf]SFD13731.1 Coenzyme PQQ synthesis protein D (PqqD) [Bacillus sp. 491mf]